jgi:hypothetical protein
MSSLVRILFVGDVVGRPGREAFSRLFPVIRKREAIDFCVVNAENAAGGSGITAEAAEDLLQAGANVLTAGDHVWRNRKILEVIDREERLLRPANYPPGAPGRGSGVFPGPNGIRIGVINLLGRVFLKPLDCPFRRLDEELRLLERSARVILVDIHAEATSEKAALARYADGRVSAVVGTHTHVPTADERILPRGTAFLTDVGMTGSIDSILGRKTEPVLKSFLSGLPAVFEIESSAVEIQCAVVEVDPETGKAVSIRRLREPAPSKREVA